MPTQYTDADLKDILVREFGADDDLVEQAVGRFISDVKNDLYIKSFIMADYTDVLIHGDIDEDAEYVYSHQEYWNLPEAPVDSVGLEDVSLPPYQDKLIKEDDEL